MGQDTSDIKNGPAVVLVTGPFSPQRPQSMDAVGEWMLTDRFDIDQTFIH